MRILSSRACALSRPRRGTPRRARAARRPEIVALLAEKRLGRSTGGPACEGPRLPCSVPAAARRGGPAPL